MVSGFIQINRELFEHPAWITASAEQKVILLTIIEKANFKPASWEWNGEIITVERGQFITSVEKLVEAGGKGITTAKVRTALKRFEKHGILTSKTTNHSTLITVENYDFITCCFDEVSKRIDKQTANDSQTDDKRIATTNKDNKNYKNKKRESNTEYSSSLRDTTLKVIGHFNKVAGTTFNGEDSAYIELVAKHLEKRHTEEELMQVIDRKVPEWKDSDNMISHVNPLTVLNLDRFDAYLNAPVKADDSKQRQDDLRAKIESQEESMRQYLAVNGEDANRSDEYMFMETQLSKYQKQLANQLAKLTGQALRS